MKACSPLLCRIPPPDTTTTDVPTTDVMAINREPTPVSTSDVTVTSDVTATKTPRTRRVPTPVSTSDVTTIPVKSKAKTTKKSSKTDETTEKIETAEEDEVATTFDKEVCVVKRCLLQSISKLMPDVNAAKFVEYVDECTDIASRLARRVSLAFLYFIVRRLELGLGIPDFEKGTDGYWTAWIRIALEEFEYNVLVNKKEKTIIKHKVYPVLVPSKTYKNLVLQDEESKAADKVIFSEIEKLFGTTIGPGRRTIPKFFDRALGHLAKQFSTAVGNLLSVNFFAKLTRACKHEIRSVEEEFKDFKKYDLLKAVCQGNVNEKETPPVFNEYIEKIRSTMGLAPDFILFEDTPLSFPKRFAVHWEIQQRLAKLGQKKLMMSPVHKVQRMHIRLDATHLALYVNDMLMEPLRDALVKPPALPKCPNKKSHPDDADRKAARAEYTVAKKLNDALKIEYAKQKKEVQEKSFFHNLTKPTDPEADLNKEIPVPSTKIPEGMSKRSPEWAAKQNELRIENDKARFERAERRKDPEFQKALKIYQDYEQNFHDFGLSMFIDFHDRNPKLGWKPSGSVMTDGVSLCVTYERMKPRDEKTCKEISDKKKAAKKAQAEAAEEAREKTPCDDYDVNANTCFEDRLILGVDPGRVTLVTIICIDPNGKKTTWRLSRGQYHTESGILAQNKLQQERYKCLVKPFATLTAEGGALRASTSAEIVKYVQAYKQFEETWFSDVALKIVEARAKMKRYSGKQRTLASFFSKVRKDAEKIRDASKLRRIEVAYGACGPTMAATGRGELAVPTTGTYKACKRAFLKESPSTNFGNVVSLEDESYTSKKCWDTGKDWEHVYKVHDSTGKEFLRHCVDKSPPAVAQGDIESVLKRKEDLKLKAKERRGGGGVVSGENGIVEPMALTDARNDARDAQVVRHIAVRGLLFCQERCMYFDRDEQSARAIAGLRCIKLSNRGRPTAFRRPAKANTVGESSSSALVQEETTKIGVSSP